MGVDTRNAGGQLGYDPNQPAQLGYQPQAQPGQPQVFQPNGPAQGYQGAPAQGFQAAPVAYQPAPQAGEVRWYFEKEGRTEGPIAQGTLMTLLKTGAVAPHTLVCSENHGQWVAAFDVPELRSSLPS
jgi:hypothetical protein